MRDPLEWPNECEFCSELQTGKSPVVDSLSRYGFANRIVASTEHSVAIAGLGPVTPGYLLILPVRHRLCVGHLPPEELSDLLELKAEVKKRAERSYGSVVLFEHGSVTEESCAGSCVPHAHLHLWPKQGADYRAFLGSRFAERRVDCLEDLRELVRSKTPYLFFEDDSSEQFVYLLDESVPSQFVRRAWARFSGCPDEYDWAVFPRFSNMVETIRTLS